MTVNKLFFCFVFCVFFSFNVFSQGMEKQMILSLDFIGEKMFFNNVFVQYGKYVPNYESGKINGKIFSFSDTVLLEFWFDEGFSYHVEGEGFFDALEYKKTLVLPFFANAEKIELFNERTGQTLIISLGFLTDNCGDSVCGSSEAFGNCPVDCLSGGQDGFCDRQKDFVCDSDCNPKWLDFDCEPLVVTESLSEDEIDRIVKQKITPAITAVSLPLNFGLFEFVIIFFVAGIFLLVFFYFFLKRNKKQFLV